MFSLDLSLIDIINLQSISTITHRYKYLFNINSLFYLLKYLQSHLSYFDFCHINDSVNFVISFNKTIQSNISDSPLTNLINKTNSNYFLFICITDIPNFHPHSSLLFIDNSNKLITYYDTFGSSFDFLKINSFISDFIHSLFPDFIINTPYIKGLQFHDNFGYCINVSIFNLINHITNKSFENNKNHLYNQLALHKLNLQLYNINSKIINNIDFNNTIYCNFINKIYVYFYHKIYELYIKNYPNIHKYIQFFESFLIENPNQFYIDNIENIKYNLLIN